MKQRLHPSLMIVALAALSGCNDTADPILPLNTRIGPAGGSFTPGANLALIVPAGALAQEQTFIVEASQNSPVAGFFAVGGAVLFGPSGLTFAMPSQVVIPYDPTLVAPGVMDSELRVGFRDTAGTVTLIEPEMVTASTNGSESRVRFSTSRLGPSWVVAPDVVSAASLFPLGDGDEYRFEDSVVITVERTTTEPNIAPTEVAKVRISRNDTLIAGIYFDDTMNQLRKVGEFAEPTFQEILGTPVLLVDERDPRGTVRMVNEVYNGFAPFGETMPAYQGVAETTTTIAERVRFDLPLGRFDTIQVPIHVRFNDTTPAAGEELIEFYFETGIGPAAIRLGAGGALLSLLGGLVDGEPLTSSGPSR